MKISAKTDYACRALLQLALHWPSSDPLPIGTIANIQQIPMKFLPHILLQLKQLGYVDSTRGKSGGYILGKAPAEIRLSDVMRAFSEPVCMLPARGQKRGRTNSLISIWKEIDEATRKQMENLTFEEISRRERNLKSAPMFEI